MSAGDGTKQRSLDRAISSSGTKSDSNGLAVAPVLVGDGERWARLAALQVRRGEGLDTILLRVDIILRVRARNKHATVQEGNGLRVVQTSDGGVRHDSDTIAEGLLRVVEKSVQVGVSSKTESSNTVVGTVHDNVRAIGKRSNARHDSLRRHALKSPGRVCSIGLGAHAVINSI